MIKKYVVRNIKNLIRNNPVLFTVMIICQIISSLILFFSYGVFRDYNEQLRYRQITSGVIQMTIEGREGQGNMDKIHEFLDKISTAGISEYDNIVIGYNTSDPFTQSYFALEYDSSDKAFHEDEHFVTSIFNDIEEGRKISMEEYRKGEHKALIGRSSAEFGDVKVGDTFTFHGIDYDVVGIFYVISPQGHGRIEIPFESAPDDIYCRYISFQFFYDFSTEIKFPSLSDYEAIEAVAYEVFGKDVSMKKPVFIGGSDTKYQKTMIGLIFLISLAAAINLVIMFRFILRSRRRSLAIYRINGLSPSKSILIYVCEAFIYSLSSALISLMLFLLVVMPLIGDNYRFLGDFVTFPAYSLLTLCFVLTGAAVCFIFAALSFKKEPVRDLREGQK